MSTSARDVTTRGDLIFNALIAICIVQVHSVYLKAIVSSSRQLRSDWLELMLESFTWERCTITCFARAVNTCCCCVPFTMSCRMLCHSDSYLSREWLKRIRWNEQKTAICSYCVIKKLIFEGEKVWPHLRQNNWVYEKISISLSMRCSNAGMRDVTYPQSAHWVMCRGYRKHMFERVKEYAGIFKGTPVGHRTMLHLSSGKRGSHWDREKSPLSFMKCHWFRDEATWLNLSTAEVSLEGEREGERERKSTCEWQIEYKFMVHDH